MSLSVSDLVRVTVNLSPLAAATRSFGVLMIAGDSNVINGSERFRTYLTIDGVATDFGTSAPEYKAAALYFGQSPKPKTLMIGRWLRVASAGFNEGGILTPAQQVLSNFTAITNGGVVIVIDGVTKTLTSLNFSGATNLNGVATIITTALSGAGVVTWNGLQFIVTSSTTGIASIVGYATTGTGTDISTLLKLTAATAIALIPGFAAETAVACAAALANMSAAWYGLMFQASVQPDTAANLAVCDFIEALDLSRIFGVTIIDTSVLSAAVTNDLASQMMAAAYRQSFNQYSQNAYAIASFFGRAFSVNFNANRSTITLMYKQEPGVVGENLTENQALTLKNKRCNVFVDYVNDTVIIQYGVMSGPAYFDEIHGLDWFQNAIQTACFNVLYTSTSKIPQTDAGVNQLTNAISGACDQAVSNGLVAPGTWNADGFGNLAPGQFLKTGYYIYAPPISSQAQSDRDARVAPPIQVAVKLAGAIQEMDVLVNVNR
jgi:hypothetical protein